MESFACAADLATSGGHTGTAIAPSFTHAKKLTTKPMPGVLVSLDQHFLQWGFDVQDGNERTTRSPEETPLCTSSSAMSVDSSSSSR